MSTVFVNVGELSRGLGEFQRIVGAWDADRLTKAVTIKAVEKIKSDTEQGKGPDGASLPAYSERYKRFRHAAGAQTAYRDLNLSGQMMAAMTYSRTPDGYEIGFVDARQAGKAHGHHFGIIPRPLTIPLRRGGSRRQMIPWGPVPATNFLSRSPEDIQAYAQQAVDYIMRQP